MVDSGQHVTAAAVKRPSKCLSGTRGNSHAGFLEGCGGREAPVPTRQADSPTGSVNDRFG